MHGIVGDDARSLSLSPLSVHGLFALLWSLFITEACPWNHSVVFVIFRAVLARIRTMSLVSL